MQGPVVRIDAHQNGFVQPNGAKSCARHKILPSPFSVLKIPLTSSMFVSKFVSAVGNLSTCPGSLRSSCDRSASVSASASPIETSVFTDDSPIFQQLAGLIADDIVAGTYAEESAVPSTYDYAVFYKMSPATAAKGVNLLVEQEVLYKKRGVGMFVASGARELLLARRRAEFHDQYIAPLVKEARKLGIGSTDLKGMIELEDTK